MGVLAEFGLADAPLGTNDALTDVTFPPPPTTQPSLETSPLLPRLAVYLEQIVERFGKEVTLLRVSDIPATSMWSGGESAQVPYTAKALVRGYALGGRRADHLKVGEYKFLFAANALPVTPKRDDELVFGDQHGLVTQIRQVQGYGITLGHVLQAQTI